MPISKAPYTRRYDHTKSRGSEVLVDCGYCGRKVPRYKTFVKFRGFRITDKAILQELERNQMHMFQQKMYICPACARFHKVVQRGKTVQKKHLGR